MKSKAACQSDDRLAEGRSSRRTTAEPRGEVGRKSMAKRWPDEQEPHRRTHRIRRPLSLKSKVCTEGVGVIAAGISVKAGASYLGRSPGVPTAAIAVERQRDACGEVSRGRSSPAQVGRRAESVADGRNRPTGQSGEAGRIRNWSAHPEKPRRKRGKIGMRASSSPSGESHSTEPFIKRQLHCYRNRRMREPHVRWCESWGGQSSPATRSAARHLAYGSSA